MPQKHLIKLFIIKGKRQQVMCGKTLHYTMQFRHLFSFVGPGKWGTHCQAAISSRRLKPQKEPLSWAWSLRRGRLPGVIREAGNSYGEGGSRGRENPACQITRHRPASGPQASFYEQMYTSKIKTNDSWKYSPSYFILKLVTTSTTTIWLIICNFPWKIKLIVKWNTS